MINVQNYLTSLDFSIDGSSTKSSKHRRELINQEINHIRTLLPLKNKSLQRLSQLEVMSMACIYIRRSHFLGNGFSSEDLEGSDELMKALPGFFLVCTLDGKLVYISNNVTDFLGHSMIDITKQGDNIYDIVDAKDHSIVRSELSNWSKGDVNFKCRIALSRYTRRQSSFFDEKMIQVSGYFENPTHRSHFREPVMIALCTPILSPAIKSSTLIRTSTTFISVHNMSMKFIESSSLCEYYLGYSNEELVGKSWYEFISVDDTLDTASSHHQEVTECGSQGISIFHGNYINRRGVKIPVAVSLQQHSQSDDEHYIICTTQVLREDNSRQTEHRCESAMVNNSNQQRANNSPYSNSPHNYCNSNSSSEYDVPQWSQPNPTTSLASIDPTLNLLPYSMPAISNYQSMMSSLFYPLSAAAAAASTHFDQFAPYLNNYMNLSHPTIEHNTSARYPYEQMMADYQTTVAGAPDLLQHNQESSNMGSPVQYMDLSYNNKPTNTLTTADVQHSAQYKEMARKSFQQGAHNSKDTGYYSFSPTGSFESDNMMPHPTGSNSYPNDMMQVDTTNTWANPLSTYYTSLIC